MNRNITDKLLALLLMLAFLTACSDDDTPGEDPAVTNQYLTGVTAEKHISKSEITDMVMDYAASQGINLPEILISGLLFPEVHLPLVTFETLQPYFSNVPVDPDI